VNYLAHIFLSGDNRQRQVGNFIGDFVKGNQFTAYPKGIRQGIILHRQIDSFTDTHPVVLDTTALLRPQFGRYSGIVTDMYFDHLLASHFGQYADNRSLRIFSANFYYSAIRYYRFLPPRVKRFIWHFITTNRLVRYATIEGLTDALTIMSNYKIPAINPAETITFLQTNKEEIHNRFQLFFPELMAFSEETSIFR
jgi:acyl carrier protein phosphodiesterase